MTGVWSIAVDATLQQARESAGCPPFLQRALSDSLTWQDRNRRQVKQTLMLGSIAPQWSAALLALGATVTIENESGTTDVPLKAFMEREVRGTPLKLHVNMEGLVWGEAHVGRTPADTPIVSAVAGVRWEGNTVSEARLALTGVWSRPVGLAGSIGELVGKPLDSEAIEALARSVEAEIEPQGDFLGSIEYRKAMAGVLTRRALGQCMQEAKHE